MQKKFLRTSILTLVIGLSLLTEIHAMATDGDTERRDPARVARRIESYQKESRTCLEKFEMQPRAAHAPYQDNLWRDEPESGLSHLRSSKSGLTPLDRTTKIYYEHCRACNTLHDTVKAMIKDRIVYNARDFWVTRK